MIVSKTPLRISFVGGGTDLPSFYEKHGGAVISTAIDKYVTVKVQENGKTGKRENENPIVQECLRYADVDGVSIEIESDVPPGSGLGGSSALTVGLLNALHRFKNRDMDGDWKPYPETIAQQACEIEIDRLGSPIGKQDQYSAAYGGFRRFRFEPNGEVRIESLKPPNGLDNFLLLFDTCIRRNANDILTEQQKTMSEKTLMEMKQQVNQMYALLQIGDVVEIGYLLHQAWEKKKSLSERITNKQIDETYRLALGAGAIGGKVLGAGNGGHILFAVPFSSQRHVIDALDGLAKLVPFQFEKQGSCLVSPSQ